MSSGETLVIDQAGATGPVNILARQAMANMGFELGQVAAAQDSHVGDRLGDVDPTCPPQWAEKRFISLEDLAVGGDGSVVYSGLPSGKGLASEYESRIAQDRFVASNASDNRGKEGVPQVNAFVNPEQIDEMYQKVAPNGGRLTGIITGGNCAAGIIAVAAAPIEKEIGFSSMSIDTMQGWSGKGFSEVPKDVDEFPEIPGDEWSKVTTEPNLFLGASADRPARIRLSGRVHRGPWVDGHRAHIKAKLFRETSKREIEHLWRQYRASKAFDAVKPQLRALSETAGHKWPKRHQPIHPVTVQYNDLVRYDTEPKRLIDVYPMRVSAHMEGVDQSNPAWIDYEVAGHNLWMGAIGVNLMNVIYARAQGYL
jgi:aspartate-semialdehyde dehydrogenase